MIRTGICLLVIPMAVGLFVFYSRKATGPPPEPKLIQISGDEPSGSFRAQIDGRTFTKASALEDYLGAFPAHTYVSAVLPISCYRPSGEDKEFDRVRKLHDELKTFCSKRGMFYDGRSPSR